LLIALVAVAALGMRLYQLDRRTITHPELFAPGIPLPAYALAPSPRYTLADVVQGTLTGDIHPPAFYIGELAWTSMFGTRLFALRLPSALLGAAAVILLYAYARRHGGEGVALLAAALLALHAEHLFWSQHARMWVPLSCLALGSALLLAKLAGHPSRFTMLAYAVVTAAGVWTDYYFWPFFLALTACAVAEAARTRDIASLDAQIVAAVLSSPMLVYLHYHVQRGNFIPEDLREPLSTLVPFVAIASNRELAALVIVVAGAAVALGARPASPVRQQSSGTIDSHSAGSQSAPVGFLLGASLAASACVVALAPVASRLTIVLAVLIPWLVSLLWCAARGRVRQALSAGWPRWNVLDDSSVTLPVATLAILVAIHVLREPVLVSRGLVMLAPFVCLLMARGALRLRGMPARGAAMAVLLLLSAATAVRSYERVSSPRDYSGLAEQVRPQIKSDDVIVSETNWWATPVHYYFPPDRFHVVPAGSVAPPLPHRVWIVVFGEDAAAKTRRLAAARLPDYVERAHAEARQAYAALYEPPVLQ
jgi:hypothetical protein